MDSLKNYDSIDEYIDKDIEKLLESLQVCDIYNETVVVQALQTLVTKCKEDHETAKTSLDKLDGLIIITKILDEAVTLKQKDWCFVALNLAIEDNVTNQSKLSSVSIFNTIRTIFSNSTARQTASSDSLLQNTILFFTNLSLYNVRGQVLARESGCLCELLRLYRETFPIFIQPISNLPSSCGTNPSIVVWQAINVALVSAINNPENKQNQDACAILLPFCYQILENSTDWLIIKHVGELLTNIMSNNENSQNKVTSNGGINVLARVLSKIANDNKEVNEDALLALLSSFNSTITDHTLNANEGLKLGTLDSIFKILKNPKIGVKVKTSAVLVISQSAEVCDNCRSYLMAYQGLKTLMSQLISTGCPELVSASIYLICLAKTTFDSIQLENCSDESNDMDDACSLQASIVSGRIPNKDNEKSEKENPKKVDNAAKNTVEESIEEPLLNIPTSNEISSVSSKTKNLNSNMKMPKSKFDNESVHNLLDFAHPADFCIPEAKTTKSPEEFIFKPHFLNPRKLVSDSVAEKTLVKEFTHFPLVTLQDMFGKKPNLIENDILKIPSGKSLSTSTDSESSDSRNKGPLNLLKKSVEKFQEGQGSNEVNQKSNENSQSIHTVKINPSLNDSVQGKSRVTGSSPFSLRRSSLSDVVAKIFQTKQPKATPTSPSDSGGFEPSSYTRNSSIKMLFKSNSSHTEPKLQSPFGTMGLPVFKENQYQTTDTPMNEIEELYSRPRKPYSTEERRKGKSINKDRNEEKRIKEVHVQHEHKNYTQNYETEHINYFQPQISQKGEGVHREELFKKIDQVAHISAPLSPENDVIQVIDLTTETTDNSSTIFKIPSTPIKRYRKSGQNAINYAGTPTSQDRARFMTSTPRLSSLPTPKSFLNSPDSSHFNVFKSTPARIPERPLLNQTFTFGQRHRTIPKAKYKSPKYNARKQKPSSRKQKNVLDKHSILPMTDTNERSWNNTVTTLSPPHGVCPVSAELPFQTECKILLAKMIDELKITTTGKPLCAGCNTPEELGVDMITSQNYKSLLKVYSCKYHRYIMEAEGAMLKWYHDARCSYEENGNV